MSKKSLSAMDLLVGLLITIFIAVLVIMMVYGQFETVGQKPTEQTEDIIDDILGESESENYEVYNIIEIWNGLWVKKA